MSVSPTSYDAAVSAALVAMVAACPSVIAWLGSTAPRDVIIEDDGGIAQGTAPEDDAGPVCAVSGASLNPLGPLIKVRCGEVTRIERGHGTWGHEGDATIAISIPPVENDSPSDAIRRGRNLAGAIADELCAQCGQATTLAWIAPKVAAPTHGEDHLVHHVIIVITLDWKDLP
jgi:hypothetical protein